jgi:uncharacterized protein
MKTKRILLGSILLCLSLLPGVAAGQPQSSAETVPQLQVRGEAELQVPADQLQLSIGVITQAETAQAALDRNSAGMQKVEQALRELGIGQQEYRTGHFGIQPQWSIQPRPNRRPEIIGFTVTNSFTVTTTRLELAGRLIEAAVQAGANSIGDLLFGLADPKTHRAEAIRQATSHARAEAQILAAAAMINLGDILFITVDQPAVHPQRLQAVRFEAMAGEPPLAPGEVTIRAEVAISFRIAPMERP